jgi:threonyl-tRNA synthetase
MSMATASEDRPDVSHYPGGEELYRIRHSAAHVLATAVTELFPDVKVAGGPPIENGFYYDFSREQPFTPEDLERIEARMREIVAARQPFVYAETTRDEARKHFEAAGEKYKLHFLSAIPADAKVTTYRNGPFLDLCRGPHLASTGAIHAFKLTHVAGAYWLGNERNEMLQRIYGTAFPTAEDLERHLKNIEEALKRDHRRLGRELDIYSMHEEVGAGLVLWHPHGGMLRHQIETLWKDEHQRRGYDFVFTPHIANEKLYQISGHLENYADLMYSPMDIDGQPYRAKPMNCPWHIMIYKTRRHSYRELPVRFAELGTVYRYERSGVLHGMERVRGFTQDDSHIFCTPDQLAGEVEGVLDLMDFLLKTFKYEYVCYLATRPKDKYLGSDEEWEFATNALRQALGSIAGCRTRSTRAAARSTRRIDVKLKVARRPRAVPDDPGRPEPAEALRRGLHRLGRSGARVHHAAPCALRLARALRRHLHRAHRRRVPRVGGAGAGDRAARERQGARLRAGDRRGARGGRHPRRGGRARGETRSEDPRRRAREDSVHDRGRAPRCRGRHRVAPPQGRRRPRPPTDRRPDRAHPAGDPRAQLSPRGEAPAPTRAPPKHRGPRRSSWRGPRAFGRLLGAEHEHQADRAFVAARPPRRLGALILRRRHADARADVARDAPRLADLHRRANPGREVVARDALVSTVVNPPPSNFALPLCTRGPVEVEDRACDPDHAVAADADVGELCECRISRADPRSRARAVGLTEEAQPAVTVGA